MNSRALAKILTMPIPPAAEPAYPVAAVGDAGGCGCAAGCGTCYPSAVQVDPDNPFIPGRTKGSPGMDAYVPYVNPANDRRCLTPIPSALTTIAAGATTPITIEPSKGCAKAYYVDVIAFDDANVQSAQRFVLGRVFVGTDCPQDCRIEGLTSDFLEGGDCNGMGVPMEVSFGRVADNEELRIEVTNINPGGSIRVQVTVWARCLPGYTCLSQMCG